ncbi:hypothetical protein AB0C76_18525 [Kitasatospora sp. NPDC048722]|uniref:hypothetical protein n=1 Tax=Kitasatospora sp. NPDC048722 TaxID=3155639 RepID=UPI0033D9FBA1
MVTSAVLPTVGSRQLTAPARRTAGGGQFHPHAGDSTVDRLTATPFLESGPPAEWRAVNDYGIEIKRCTHDGPELTPLRRQNSGVTTERELWEVHRAPDDVSWIWARNHRDEQRPWIQATGKHPHRASVPFGDLAGDHVGHRRPGATEQEIADAVAALFVSAPFRLLARLFGGGG